MAHDDEPKALVALTVLAVALYVAAWLADPAVESQHLLDRGGATVAAGVVRDCVACAEAGRARSGLFAVEN